VFVVLLLVQEGLFWCVGGGARSVVVVPEVECSKVSVVVYGVFCM